MFLEKLKFGVKVEQSLCFRLAENLCMESAHMLRRLGISPGATVTLTSQSKLPKASPLTLHPVDPSSWFSLDEQHRHALLEQTLCH